jgi:hypothetical protein
MSKVLPSGPNPAAFDPEGVLDRGYSTTLTWPKPPQGGRHAASHLPNLHAQAIGLSGGTRPLED